MKNNTSWTPYNPEYPEPILNQDVQNGDELKLATEAERLAALEKNAQVMEDAYTEIFGKLEDE